MQLKLVSQVIHCQMKTYNRREICEILKISYNQTHYAMTALRIKPISKAPGAGKNHRAGFYTKENIDDIKMFCDQVKSIDKPRLLKTQAVKDAGNGQHDRQGTDWLRACSKYQIDNKLRYLTKSAYLEIFKSMGRDWLDNFLSTSI